MRTSLGKVVNSLSATCRWPDFHIGLAYDVWAPVKAGTGKVPDEDGPGQVTERDWLADLQKLHVHSDYRCAFGAWRRALQSTGALLADLTLTSRLLVGHGNAAPAEVGLTVHRTWGVPTIPGSSLKGLLAHYVDAVYGPDVGPDGQYHHPQDPSQSEADRERARFQGPSWSGNQLLHAPGEVYAALFGAPPTRAEHIDLWTGAAQGCVVFHDAVMIPSACGEPEDTPFAVDVLTVHQRAYYEGGGARAPNDYDSPNPVAFLTVKPGTRLLVALGGPADWAQFAMELLRDALDEWGVGGKTAAGYGRGNLAVPAPQATQDLLSFEKWLAERKEGGPGGAQAPPQRETADLVERDWMPRLLPLPETDRRLAAAQIQKHLRSRKLQELVAGLVTRLEGGGPQP